MPPTHATWLTDIVLGGTLPLSTEHGLYHGKFTWKCLIITNEVLCGLFSWTHCGYQSGLKAKLHIFTHFWKMRWFCCFHRAPTGATSLGANNWKPVKTAAIPDMGSMNSDRQLRSTFLVLRWCFYSCFLLEISEQWSILSKVFIEGQVTVTSDVF